MFVLLRRAADIEAELEETGEVVEVGDGCGADIYAGGLGG